MTATLRFVIACIGFPALAALPVQAQDAAKMAREAFYAMEAAPFQSEVVEKAMRDLERAHKSSPNDPWVLIAISRAYLERGYIKGDRSRLASYAADAVKAADTTARRAAELAPQESMAHVQVARIQIITENYRGAWDTLNRAHALDNRGFYPWYYRGVLSLKMKDAKRAGEAFDEAHARATAYYQKEWTVGRRIDLARLDRDVAAEERGLKALIAMAPEKPHPYGNYALFLKKHRRYDEAIENYHKAIAIQPYPLAVEQLKQTILLRDAKK